MTIALSLLLGLIWGALFAWLGSLPLRRALVKDNTQALLAANLARSLVDVGALALPFLLRERLPVSINWFLIAAALALSLQFGSLLLLFADQFPQRMTNQLLAVCEYRGDARLVVS